MKPANIVLIGMPGAGKSTVGVILAKEASMDFVDTDVLIQIREGRSLQHIVDTDGYLVLRDIEQKVLLDLSTENHVIATGGSAVYSDAAMKHLKRNAVTVFLAVTLDTICDRVNNFATRGLAKRDDQSIDDLFEERLQLYRKYADITIPSDNLGQDEVCEEIVRQLDN